MKKIVLSLMIISAGTAAFAQKAKLREAKSALNDAQKSLALKNTEEASIQLSRAKEAIDAAAADASTSDKAETYFVQSAIYSAMGSIPKFESEKPFVKSTAALMQAMERDKKIAKEDNFKSVVANNAYSYFNEGVSSMNAAKYQEAYSSFNTANKLFRIGDGKLFAGNQPVDTIMAKADLYTAYTAYYSDKFPEAIEVFKKVQQNPITGSESNAYVLMANAYGKTGNKELQLKTIEAARSKLGNDPNVTAAEINYYIDNNQTDVMIRRLEDEVKKDPGNHSYYNNLGFAYRNMAENATGTAKDEYTAKAAKSFSKALELEPTNADYAYQNGILYFNNGVDYNDQMNTVTGTDAASQKKYDGFKAKRDALFEQALPFFEKANNLIKGKSIADMSISEKQQYKQVLQALTKIYSLQNKMEEIKPLQDKLDQL